MAALEEVFRLALDVQPAGQDALGAETVVDLLPHGVPDILEKIPDLRAFIHLHILRKADLPPRAELRDLREGVFRIDLRRLQPRTALNDDIAAADGLHADGGGFFRTGEGGQIERVRVLEIVGVVLGKDDLHVLRREHIAQHAVGAVADAGLGKRAVENDLVALCIRVFGFEDLGGSCRPHRVGAGGAFSDFVKIADGFHSKGPR